MLEDRGRRPGQRRWDHYFNLRPSHFGPAGFIYLVGDQLDDIRRQELSLRARRVPEAPGEQLLLDLKETQETT